MKLHLPKPLRNSVLACIAAVAGIATPTLGTATFAGGVVAFTLASQQAMADVTISDAQTWDTDAEGDLGLISVAGEAANLTISGGTHTTGGKLELKNGGNATVTDGVLTVNQIQLHNAWANTQETLRIEGGVVNVQSSESNINTSAAILIGHWPGSNSYGKLTLDGTGELNVQNGGVVVGWDSVGVLEIAGGTANLKSVYLNRGTLEVTGGQLNVLNGGSIGRSGNAANGFTVSGGTVSLGEGAVINSALTLSGEGKLVLGEGATINSALTLVGNSAIETTSSSSVFGGNVSVNLTDCVSTTGADGSVVYTVLTGTGNKDMSALSSSNIEFGTYRMGKTWTYGTDGTISYKVTSKDVVWSEGASLSWNATGSAFTTGGEFANGDNVTFSTSAEVTIGEGGVEAVSLVIQGEGTHVKLTNASPIYVGEKVVVKDGAKLELAAESGGAGVIRAESSGYGGEIVVEDGGVLHFSAKDVTGYNGGNNSTKVISVNAGGTLELGHVNNETFSGTLNLDGVLKGVSTGGAARWDLFGNNARINVSAGATAKMENASLCLRGDNVKVNVGEGGSLTIEKDVNVNGGNGVLVKEGAGALLVQGEATNSGFTVNGGSVEIKNTQERTMTISGAAGTSFTKNGAGIINMGNVKEYSYAGEMIVKEGEIKFTSDANEQAAAQPGIARLYNNLVTAEGAKAVVEGDVSINYQAQDAQFCTPTLNGNLEITGGMQLNSFGSGNAPDGDSMRRWNIESDGALTVGGALWLTNKQKMVVSGGDLVAAGGIILGHGENGAGGAYKAKVQLDSGSVTTSGIEFKGGHNSVVMNGGTLEFTSENVFTGGADNNSNQINLLGGTLKVSTSDVNLTGSAQYNLTMGGVGIDVASGMTARLGGAINLSATVAKTGTGTLRLDNGLVLSVDNLGAFERGTNSTYTDFDGSTTSGNGFFSGSILLIAGDYNKAGSITVQVGGTAVTNYVEDSAGLGVSVTDNSTYFVNTGTVTLTESKDVSSFYIASGAVLAYEAGDFTATLSGSGTYRPASVMQTGAGAYMTPGITFASDWTGIVELRNSQIMGVNFNSLGTAQSSVKLNGLGTWIHTSHKNIVTNLILENYSEERSALIITDSSQNNEYIFNGSVSGTGDFEMATRAGSACVFTFTGDTSKWSGDIFASGSYNLEPYTTEANTTPNFTVKLTGAGDVFDPTGDSTITMNRGGTMFLQLGNETKDSTLNATIAKNAGNIEITVNHGASKTTVAKEVNATKLTVNGYGEFLENVTLSGNIAFSGNQTNRLVLHGDNNIAQVIDLSNANAAVGVLELKKGAVVTSRSSLWMRPDASILLEEGSSVIWDDTKVTGKAGSVAEIKASANAAQWMDTAGLQVKDATFEVSKNETRTVAALLQNSSIINSGTALVTVTNAANTLTGVEAKAGNILVQNATTGSLVGLGAITAADGLSVSAEVASAQVSAVTLGAGSTFSTTGALAVADGSALSLGADAAISMNGALTLGSGLVLTVSDVARDTTLFSGVTSIATSLDDITAYISSINGLTDLTDYSLSLNNGNLVLVVDKGKTVTWDAANSTWKDSAQFGATTGEADSFYNGDMVVFGNLAADEAVTIEGEVHALDMKVDATAGKTYTFTAAADGGTLTVPTLSVTSGKAVFGANTIQLDSLASVTVAESAELDLSAYGLGAFGKVVTKTTGDGLVKIGGYNGDKANVDAAQLQLRYIDGGSLTLAVNYDVDGSVALTGNQSAGGEVVTINKNLSVSKELRIESQAGVTVAQGGLLEASTISLGHNAEGNPGHLAMTGGAIKAGQIISTDGDTYATTNNTFRMEGGSLELTTDGASIEKIGTTITGGTLVANEASWGIAGATIGGATVTTEGDYAITLTDTTLTSTLNNAAGKLVLTGTVDITSTGYQTTSSPREYDNNGNGYAKNNTAYDVVTTVGNLTIADGTTWTVDGSSDNVTYADGVVTVAGSDWGTEYYVRTVDATLSGIAKANIQNEALTTIVLAGKDLNMDVALGNVRIRVEKEGESIVAVGGDFTLAASQVTGTDATHQLKLQGSGTYALAAGTATLGNGTVLGDWTGTVKVTNATGLTYFNIDALGNADSTVELTGVSGHLLATTADNETTYNTNLKLVDDGDIKALTLTDGWKAGTNVFAGDVSGSGSFVMASDVPSGMSVKFTGNLSEWDGAFVGNNTDKSVNLNIASTGNVGADIISQQGTLNVTFSGASTTMKGDIGYGTGVLNMTVAAGASVEMEGTLADNVALTSNGSLSLTQDTVSLASLGGTGSVSAKAMTLTGATYSMGDLKLTGALTLSESVTSLTTGKLNIAGGVNISSIASNLFSVSTIENGLTLNITEELLEGTLGTMEDKRVALLTLTGEFADTSVLQAVKDSVLLGAFDANGTAGQKQEGAMYDYELVWNGNTMELVASIAASACTWVGGTDYSWDTAANWSSIVGGVPSAETAVFIKGDTLTARTNIALEKTVNGEVVGVDAEVKSLTIEAWGVRQPVNIGGMGSLSIGGNLTLQSGELALLADTSIGGNIVINNQSILKLAGMDPESAPTISVDGKLVNNFQMYVDGAEVTIEGDAANKGSLVVMGGSLEINGTTTNEGTIAVAGGSLSTGDVANTGDIIIAAGSMDVDGNLSHSGENSSIVVNSGSSLEVTGYLNAANMTLDFDGNVTVGGTATVGTLTNDGTFTAANAIIGTLTNNGTLSVDKEVTITTLAGTGNLTVGEGGTLYIENDATFTGTVDNKGTVKTENTMTLSNKTDKGGTIEAADLMVQAGANGSVFTSVTTDSITIETLDSGVTNLTTGALAGKTDESAVTLVVNQLTTEEGMNEIIGAGARDYNLLSIGGNAPEITVAELEYEREQQLWQSGLKLAMSGVSTMDLRARETKVGLSVQQQTEKEGTWNVGDTTTGIGLVVVDSSGKLVNNNVLDNVQKVVVSGAKSIDMTGSISTAKLNKLTGTSGSKLTIEGDGKSKDTVTIAKTSAYMGTLVLDGVTADFDLTGATVAGADGDTALSGKLTEGTLSVKQASTAQGKGLELIGSTVEVDITKDSMSLGTDALNKLESALVDLGDVSLDADTTVELGTYDTKTGEFIKSVGYSKYFDMDNLRVEGGKVLADRNTTYYTSKLADSTSTDNGKIGLAMADEALLSANPQGATSTGDLAAVLDQLDAMVVTGNKAAADELGASLAGASTAVLGMAAMGDVDRQLRAIRNRTTTMGVDQSVVNADMPYFNAWINAEGDSREMGDDGTLGGYKLNSYGGTVGFDVDIEPTLTAGMALTAMYGDLDATGADKATGNLDSYYVSAFARYCGSAWTHTFVGTIGKGDISLDRTVADAQVKGETDSMSFGLMYEVGRVYAMDEDGTTCLQPVFNVTWKHTTVDAYTEKGGDVALTVDEQSLNTITFGLGARLQTVVGESMYNRTSIFECRLLAKAEAGDTEGTSKVALGGLPSHEVKSNEMGAIGIEVGAGLTIPLGDEGSSIFMDASAEIRADYTDVNGTVGYRVNF